MPTGALTQAASEDGSALTVDVLVAGGGMAGLTAGLAAAELGASVGLVEKREGLGGSAAISSGNLWTARSFEELRQRVPAGDPQLARVLADRFEDAVAWMARTGVAISEPTDGVHHGWGKGRHVDIDAWIRGCAERVAGSGFLVRKTSVRRLIIDDAGRVIGARTQAPDGMVDVYAQTTILATGGFQGDRELRARYLGSGGDELILRANPGSVGDGFRLGLEAGAATSSAMSSFYGHLLPSPLTGLSESQFLSLKQSYSAHCILLNRDGRRFVDESQGDEVANQAVLRQRGSRAVLLADAETHRRWVVRPLSPGGQPVDTFAEAQAAGARYMKSDDLHDLAVHLEEWGLPRGNVEASLRRYAVASEEHSVEVDAPMPTAPKPLQEAPFHALEVQPAITFSFGGLRIDTGCGVLDRDGERVPGLYAAGADAGGIYNVAYAGGLAMSLVFGRIAGEGAALAAQ